MLNELQQRIAESFKRLKPAPNPNDWDYMLWATCVLTIADGQKLEGVDRTEFKALANWP